MKIAVYTRISTKSDSQETSFKNQKNYFTEAVEKSKNQLYKIYSDEGLTGTKLNNRKGFLAMLADAGVDHKDVYKVINSRRVKDKETVYYVSDRTPQFDEIWLKNTSRMARTVLAYDIVQKLRAKGVSIYFLEQNINTKDISSDLLLKLFQVFDAQDSVDKSIKVQTGIKQSAKSNVIRTNKRIYGYKYIEETNSLKAIPDEAKTIQTIFALYVNGKGIRQIINYLKTHNMYTRKGKDFGKSSIRRILGNEKYMGYNPVLKWDSGFIYTQKHSPQVKDNYKILKNDRIDVIIEPEQFQQVQKMLEEKVNVKNQIGIYKGVSRYAGHIICGNCGHTYTSNIDKGRHFFNCGNKKAHGISVCDNPNVSLALVDDEVSKNYERSKTEIPQLKKSFVYGLYYRSAKIIENESNINKDKIDKQTADIKATENKLNGLYDLYAQNITSKNLLLKKIRETESMLKEQQRLLNDYKQPLEAVKDKIYHIRDVINIINKMPDTFNTEDEFIQNIVITVNDEGYPIIEYAFQKKFVEIYFDNKEIDPDETQAWTYLNVLFSDSKDATQLSDKALAAKVIYDNYINAH